MFLHVSVILFTGDWLPSMHNRSHVQGGCIQGGGVLRRGGGGVRSASKGVLHPRGRGVCIRERGVYLWEGGLRLQGVCIWGREVSTYGGGVVCIWGGLPMGGGQTPPPRAGTGKSGGTHPTGMLSS